MLGKLLAFSVRLLNVVPRAIEKVADAATGGGETLKQDRLLSVPLEKLAEALEEIDGEKP